MRCMQVQPLPGGYFYVVGAVQDWDHVTAGVLEVERVRGLTGWGEWTGLHRLRRGLAGQGWSYYFVAEQVAVAPMPEPELAGTGR
ncbi:MAG TPA: hypothetical protein VIA06_07870 [Candidatus Dormibacteraeota bacterium]|nr:hypothetical protein [Candidatus Dormibacteraeota bacterium]